MAAKDQTVFHHLNDALNPAFDVIIDNAGHPSLAPAPAKPSKPQHFTITISAGEGTMSHPAAIQHTSTQPKLLDQVRATIRMMHYSRRTENAYIDFTFKKITVREGKGQKDRVTMLPEAGIPPLEKYLEEAKTSMKKNWLPASVPPTCRMRFRLNFPMPTANGDDNMTTLSV
jgi:hypothetical protein